MPNAFNLRRQMEAGDKTRPDADPGAGCSAKSRTAPVQSFPTKVRALFCCLGNQAVNACGGARVESELDADRATEKTSAIACRRVMLRGPVEAGDSCGPAHCGVVAARVF